MATNSKRDYYEVLGVTRTVGEIELKSAYRKLALRFHPDRNPNNPDAEEKFKELSEAYAVLADVDKRATYDRFGHAGLTGTMAPNAPSNVVMPDIFGFGEMFRGLDQVFASMFGRPHTTANSMPRHEYDLERYIGSVPHIIFSQNEVLNHLLANTLTAERIINAAPAELLIRSPQLAPELAKREPDLFRHKTLEAYLADISKYNSYALHEDMLVTFVTQDPTLTSRVLEGAPGSCLFRQDSTLSDKLKDLVPREWQEKLKQYNAEERERKIKHCIDNASTDQNQDRLIEYLHGDPGLAGRFLANIRPSILATSPKLGAVLDALDHEGYRAAVLPAHLYIIDNYQGSDASQKAVLKFVAEDKTIAADVLAKVRQLHQRAQQTSREASLREFEFAVIEASHPEYPQDWRHKLRRKLAHRFHLKT